jgi:outer membrane protein
MKKLFGVISTTAVISPVFALSLEVGGGPQLEHYRGWVQYKGTQVDLKNDLHIEDKTKYFIYLNLRHKGHLGPIPLPNVKFEYLEVKSSGTGYVSKDFTFGGITFTVRDRVYSKVKFNQYDTTLYYTPLKTPFVKGLWGLGVKVIDFKATVTSLTTGRTETASATIPLPYLYLKASGKYKIFRASAEGKGIRYGGNYFYEWIAKAGIGYSFIPRFEVGLDGGYRYQRYRVDDVDDVSSDVKIKGAFASASLTFKF